MSEWENWIGREELRRDRVDEALTARWHAALDIGGLDTGAMPQGFHFCLCTPDAPTARLGLDGHPQRDESPQSFFPPVPLPRRMWASSKIEFVRPLQIGESVERRSRLASVVSKQGATGSLVFVDVEHETSGANGLAVLEVQSLVYRDAVPPGSPPAPPPPGPDRFDSDGWDQRRVLHPSEVLLFRFSALTFNTHRIHYDFPYASGEEGYRGLVVHGPLIATLLLDLAGQHFGANALKTFEFRAVSPAVCGEELNLVLRGSGDEIELGAFASDGRQTMSAKATS